MSINGGFKPPNGGERPKRQGKKRRNECVALARIVREERSANAAEDAVRQKFIEAYELSFGNVTYCCDVAGISRTTFYRWKRGKGALDVEFQRRLEEIRPADRFLDMAEGRLAQLMASSDERVAVAAVQFALRTRGRLRGYAERQEQQNAERDRNEESLRMLRASIEHRAREVGRSYLAELRFFLDRFGDQVKPDIREKLMSELKCEPSNETPRSVG